VLKDDKLVGACLYGDTVDGSWYFKLLRDGRSVADIRDRLMFGESNIGDAGHQGQSKAAAMADSDEVCGCNGVTKGHLQGHQGQGPVHAGRGAQAHQGQCQLRLLHGPGGADPHVHRRWRLLHAQDQGHVRLHRPRPPGRARRHPPAQAAEHRAVFRFMEWKTPNGCASCRPAVNYYLISTWPKEARDDPQSRRFINERSHANIQKDGTYSVIPRMWGGETTAAELRRIADVVDKYRSPP
jgi:nitrite reductase (NADH) large subunit